MSHIENRIFLRGDQAKAFFEEARHPDLECLRRRDAFLSEWERECEYSREGTDLVMRVSNPELENLFCEALSERKNQAAPEFLARDVGYSAIQVMVMEAGKSQGS